MIILDTNVVSELMRPDPADAVAAWFVKQQSETIVTTSITVAEVLFGIERLPHGKRRHELTIGFDKLMAEGFHDRLLLFDGRSAAAYAKIFAQRLAVGRPIEAFDAMIAAIAVTNGADVATRDRKGFEDCGVRVINPWA